MEFYKKAVLGNERIALINDLYQTGYDPHEVIKLILKEFNENSESTYLWEYGDLLYRIHDKSFLKEYCLIASNQSFGTARQMIILLIGECKDPSVIEILIDLLSDDDVRGHALEALSHFRDIKIYNIMKLYADCQTKWIRNVAISYLKHFD